MTHQKAKKKHLYSFCPQKSQVEKSSSCSDEDWPIRETPQPDVMPETNPGYRLDQKQQAHMIPESDFFGSTAAKARRIGQGQESCRSCASLNSAAASRMISRHLSWSTHCMVYGLNVAKGSTLLGNCIHIKQASSKIVARINDYSLATAGAIWNHTMQVLHG